MATVHLNEAAVRAAFEAATSQADYLVALYCMILPAWDTIERIDHWPACNDTTWKAICRLAQGRAQYTLDCCSIRRRHKRSSGRPEKTEHLIH